MMQKKLEADGAGDCAELKPALDSKDAEVSAVCALSW